jgi:hypothetical protein
MFLTVVLARIFDDDVAHRHTNVVHGAIGHHLRLGRRGGGERYEHK